MLTDVNLLQRLRGLFEFLLLQPLAPRQRIVRVHRLHLLETSMYCRPDTMVVYDDITRDEDAYGPNTPYNSRYCLQAIDSIE